MNIKDLDLNLLRALDKLIECRNVSKAADHLGVTQPAMSNILARLRRAFNDDLLIKVGREMDLTPMATELSIPLRSIMGSIQSDLLDRKQFDPSNTAFHFKLAFHDYEQLVIHSKLLPLLLKKYPHITIEHVSPREIHPTDDLGSGVIDFSTSPIIKDRAGILRKRLFTDQFVCLADRTNKTLKTSELNLKMYCELEHIFIAPHGGKTGQVDSALAAKNMNRKVRLSVTEFSTLPWLLKGSNLLVTLPNRAAQLFASQHKNLMIHECPVRINPVEIYLSWHDRLGKSAPHMWLKDLIGSATASP